MRCPPALLPHLTPPPSAPPVRLYNGAAGRPAAPVGRQRRPGGHLLLLGHQPPDGRDGDGAVRHPAGGAPAAAGQPAAPGGAARAHLPRPDRRHAPVRGGEEGQPTGPDRAGPGGAVQGGAAGWAEFSGGGAVEGCGRGSVVPVCR